MKRMWAEMCSLRLAECCSSFSSSWNVTSSGEGPLLWPWCFSRAHESSHPLHDCGPLYIGDRWAWDTIAVYQLLATTGQLRNPWGHAGPMVVHTHWAELIFAEQTNKWVPGYRHTFPTLQCIKHKNLPGFSCFTLLFPYCTFSEYK